MMLMAFFLVTWTVERAAESFLFNYKVNDYQMRLAKGDSGPTRSLFEGQKSFETLEAARKFIREAPKERSEYGDRVFDFKLQVVRDVK